MGVVKQNGVAIGAFREARGHGQTWLAHQIGRSRSFICRIESEERGAGDDTIRSIATALGVPVAAITREKPRDQE